MKFASRIFMWMLTLGILLGVFGQEAEIAASLDALSTLKPEVAQKRGSVLLNLKCADVQVTPLKGTLLFQVVLLDFSHMYAFST
jgi:hypothetical protein